MVLTLVLCDQTSNLLKYSVARLRPCYSSQMLFGGLHVLENRGSFFGFFSAHAANAFGLAMCSSVLFRYDKKHTYKAFIIMIFTWAALLSFSRIFVGKHYFGDITVGAMIGCIYGLIVAMAARWMFARFIDRKKSRHLKRRRETKFLDGCDYNSGTVFSILIEWEPLIRIVYPASLISER